MYDDGTVSGNENLNTDSRAIYKPSYSGSHIKAINGATIQAASVFAIGYAEHFLSGTVVKCQSLTPTQTLEQRH